MIDWESMNFSYFMRSQNCTYAMDSAKKAIVTAIQRMSCICYSSALSAGFSNQRAIRRFVAGAFFCFCALKLIVTSIPRCRTPAALRGTRFTSLSRATRKRSQNSTAAKHRIASANRIITPAYYRPHSF
jgi:hypothetical protein